MTVRLSIDARAAVFKAADAEARQRGQGRLGTHHLLLGLLADPAGIAGRALGMDLETGRRALDELDARALAAVGVHADAIRPQAKRARGRLPFTDGARSALKRAVGAARATKSKVITARHLTVGLVEAEAPDPVISLLRVAGVDIARARTALHDLP
jgi:ATP-dependent Clp protease ATP-binding subunit ClpA